MPDPLRAQPIALAVDCAFGPLSAAIVQGPKVLWQRGPDDSVRAAEGLADLVAEGLSACGLFLDQFDRFAVTVGPGGFTSLRAGMAYAKGLAFATGRPLLGFTTLEALALSLTVHAGQLAGAAIDAKRDEVFIALYRQGQPVVAPALWPASEIAARWPRLERQFILCGSGAAIVQRPLAEAGLTVDVVPRIVPDTAAMAIHALALDPAARPAGAVYLREADARLPS